MKHVIVTFIILAAFLAGGCSDGATTSPVSATDVQGLTKGFVSPSEQTGKLSVNEWLELEGISYYVTGEISYDYNREEVFFTFKSDANLAVEQSIGKSTEVLNISDAHTTDGYTRIPTVVERYEVREGTDLVVTISLQYPVSIAHVSVESPASRLRSIDSRD